MKVISSQSALKPVLAKLSSVYMSEGNLPHDYWQLLETEVLRHKVKFPVLEYLALQLNDQLSSLQENELLEKLAEARHISCYPVIGKLLQLRPAEHLEQTYQLAIQHIIRGDEWYVCDIISERVFGEGALHAFDESLAHFQNMGNHEIFWIQRSIGIASHYATKKKLDKAGVEQLLLLMITHAHKTQYFTKKGIGWAGKTIARHHPDLIRKHENHMKSVKLSRWFIGKVNIGLSMAKAAPFNYE